MIDRNRLLLEIESDENKAADAMQFERYSEMVKRQPSVDAVPVVRCKHCIYRWECDMPWKVDGDWFCADGKREVGNSDAVN